MIVIILAAGKGSRLYPLTKDKPKCLVKYKNKSILTHQLEILKKNKLKKIFLVSGYKSNKIKKKNLVIVKNNEYKKTNMLYSLFKLEELFDGRDDILISYGDIIYKDIVLKKIIKSKHDFSTIIDKNWLSYWKKRMTDPILDAESLILDNKNNILDIGQKVKSLKKIQGQYIGLTKISKNKTKDLLNIWKKIRKNKKKLNEINNLYLTDFFRILIKQKFKLKAIFIKRNWLEFDTKEDLKINF